MRALVLALVLTPSLAQGDSYVRLTTDITRALYFPNVEEVLCFHDLKPKKNAPKKPKKNPKDTRGSEMTDRCESLVGTVWIGSNLVMLDRPEKWLSVMCQTMDCVVTDWPGRRAKL